MENYMFEDNEESRDFVINMLRIGVINVTFTKVDGSKRIMKCTLLQDKIPEDKIPKGSDKKQNDEVIRVFDVESDGWRSFRWDSVIEVLA